MLYSASQQQCERDLELTLHYLDSLGLRDIVRIAAHSAAGRHGNRLCLAATYAQWCAPGYNTLQLCHQLDLDPHAMPQDRQREILLAMLLGPVTFEFPSHAELMSAVRMRQHIVEAGYKTSMDFHTEEADRPTEYWSYSEDTGFILKPGKSLITALQMATQPEHSGRLYAFSCYRATEYVILLGVAQELAISNPSLFSRLQDQWQARAIMSGKFHDTFLREYGSMEQPLPPHYYVPGDRLWFRNPDEPSSDVTGYEGSWVLYLGNGEFTNFWQHGKPYSLTRKCVEIYHWRNGTWRDSTGTLQMNEDIVNELTERDLNDPQATARILECMMRYRDPSGTYRDGGCIDTTREQPRWVHPETSDLLLP